MSLAEEARSTSRKSRRPADSKSPKGSAGEPVLLSGGNPQIPKGYGDAPVQAYIAAMPGWKSGAGRRIDELVVRALPDVQKAVKWNSPFYGMEDGVWFMSFHVFAKYVKVAFFRGALLDPPPPEPSKSGDTRYYHVYEDGGIDEKQFTAWVKQASELPGERM